MLDQSKFCMKSLISLYKKPHTDTVMREAEAEGCRVS